MTVYPDTWYQTAWEYYQQHGRHDLPWRAANAKDEFDPYNIMVSEVMLQQTQVGRVTPKYQQFIRQFPTVEALAGAPLADVLLAWSGLGYNRRAKFLWQAAQMVVSDYKGNFPQTIPELAALPGIGANTAGAIAAYAFNRPVLFIETNIRTVVIHHVFADETNIKDNLLLPALQEAMDWVLAQGRDPRQWYWALMDYGTFLKQTVGNLNRQSAAYAKQSKFEGSRRQIRGQVLRLLAAKPLAVEAIAAQISDQRLQPVLDDLTNETIISKRQGQYHLGWHA